MKIYIHTRFNHYICANTQIGVSYLGLPSIYKLSEMNILNLFQKMTDIVLPLWLITIIPSGEADTGHCQEFETSLDYLVYSRIAWATRINLVAHTYNSTSQEADQEDCHKLEATLIFQVSQGYTLRS